MKINRSFGLRFICLLFSVFFCLACAKKQTPERTLVVVSMDGFRWDFPEYYHTPVLDSIEQFGVRAKSIVPCFPTTTFANHYTMATGLYPDAHGIVSNSFFAPELNERYVVGDSKFYNGEPIWVSAEKQGLKTAVFFWVGSEAAVQNIRPTYWKKFDSRIPYEQRIDTVVHWLSLEDPERPNLVMLYFEEPDLLGHKKGLDSIVMKPMIQYLDSLIGVLTAKLNQLPIAENIDLIVMSDHGMAQLSENKIVLLNQLVDTALIEFSEGYNPVLNIKTKVGKTDEVYEKLKQSEHLQVWKHGELPEYLHYGNNPRTLDLTVCANDGWSIYWSWESRVQGAHGYDFRNSDMHAIFYAIGPSFKKSYKKESFQNIHLYSLMAKLLAIDPAKNQGKLDSISDLLH
jgi:alkaline phosphatase D